jgi:hypothetical protein
VNRKVKLSVLFLRENDSWVGQCLEHDIVAQGRTIDEAKAALSHTIAAQMCLDATHGKMPLADIKAAPEYYLTKFEHAEKLKYTAEISDESFGEAEVEDVRLAVA